jgi:hypothetical protein
MRIVLWVENGGRYDLVLHGVLGAKVIHYARFIKASQSQIQGIVLEIRVIDEYFCVLSISELGTTFVDWI